MNKPIVWTIAGSDSGGGAGIQADLATFLDLKVYGCSAITALTAQNSVEVLDIEYASPRILDAQLQALANDLPARALKLGMLGHQDIMATIAKFLAHYSGPIVIDPVMIASTGAALFAAEATDFFKRYLIPYAHVLTPNCPEAEALTGHAIQSLADLPTVAQELLNLGARSVLIKGGHLDSGTHCFDYWSNNHESFWLKGARFVHTHTHGAGCTLSAALTAYLAHGYPMQEALVLARRYVSAALRRAVAYGAGVGPLAHGELEYISNDMPHLVRDPISPEPICASMPHDAFGLYPIVPNLEAFKKLLPYGLKIVQLRQKELSGSALAREIQQAIALAKEHHIQLFINDYFHLAQTYGAFGVHVGQEDLQAIDALQLAQSGLRVGVSVHNNYELAQALALNPSYIAFGPIFSTQTKKMSKPQGVTRLAEMRKVVTCPLVAIGGIQLNNVEEVLACGVDGVAVISALQHASDIKSEISKWCKKFV